MLKTKPANLGAQLKAYLLTDALPKTTFFKHSLNSFTELFILDWNNLTLEEKLSRVASIEETIEEVTSLNKTNKRISDFKNHPNILKLFQAWKTDLKNLPNKVMHHKGFFRQIQLAYDSTIPISIADTVDSEMPFDYSKQIRFVRSESLSYAQLLQGSSFLTNRQSLEPTIMRIQHVLDSAVSGYLTSKEGAPISALLALGDGCGGHWEREEDEAISRASYFASKSALNTLALFKTAEECLNRIPQILSYVKQVTRRKVAKIPAREGNTTLLAVRSFSTEDNQHRIIGFNIGDCLLAGYDFDTHQIQTLSPAHDLVFTYSEGTAMFPGRYHNDEVRIIDMTVPSSMHLIAMSDGLYHDLPHIERKGTYPKQGTYKETLLNSDVLNSQLSNVDSVQTLHETLFSIAIAASETHRKKQAADAHDAQMQLQVEIETFNHISDETMRRELRKKIEELQATSTIQLGDDITLIGLSLPTAKVINDFKSNTSLKR